MEKIRGNRKLGFLLVLVGCVFFVFRGFHDERVALQSCDFLPVYSGARCMVKGLDPYNAKALLEVNKGTEAHESWVAVILGDENPIYPPTSLFLLTPLGAMGWVSADRIWLVIEGISFSVGTLLVWELCADDAPVMAGVLLCAFTASSTMLMMTANPTCLAVGLCVVGVWCALRRRLVWLGVICFALSLLLKPQIGGFVWLYFLLSAPEYRRFAWKVLAATAVIGLPAIVWVSAMPASQHWLPELYRTVRTSMGPGGTADPGIGNPTSFGYLNLQAIFVLLWDDPHFYNWMTYAITGPMILLWIWTSAKSAATRRTVWLGLAAGVALSVLPMYHREYDGRVLLLLFPAAMLLWSERSRKGWLAVGCVVSLTLVLLNKLYHLLRINVGAVYAGPLWRQLADRPYPFIMLAVAAIFLWMYVQAARGAHATAAQEDKMMAPADRVYS